MNVRYFPRLALCAVGLICGARELRAQDFYWNAASTRSTGMGGVYVASSTNVVDALSTNPAGLSYLRGRNLNLDVDAVFARGSFENASNADAPMGNSPGVVPFGAFGMPIGKSRFSFGLGMTPELLSRGDWHYVDAPGVAGASYGLQKQFSEIYALRYSAGVGFAVNSRLSIGATFGADYNSNRLDAPYIFQSQPALAGLKTLLDMHTTGYGWNESVGVLARPTKKLQAGLAWKSRTVIDSTGNASGDAYAQFAALGVNAPSNFTYNAQVRNVLPQSVGASLAWQADRRWLLAFQMDWVNWQDSFVNLPVTMTNGTNAVINSLVGGTSFSDGVPLAWKDQYVFHVGAERSLTESVTLRAGYSHANNPVPSSTLTPLTAAIFTDQISTGLSYQHGHAKYEAAYSFSPQAIDHVGQSGLLYGEYNDSTVRVGTQSLKLGLSYQF
jgi:long-subunit fatty acid transport protein